MLAQTVANFSLPIEILRLLPFLLVGIIGLTNAGKVYPHLQFPTGFGNPAGFGVPPSSGGSPGSGNPPYQPPLSGGPSSPFQGPPIYTGPRPLSIGTGPVGGLAPTDIQNAYNTTPIPTPGRGTTLALVELDGYYAPDIGQYEALFSVLPPPPPTFPQIVNILLDGFQGKPVTLGGQIEVTLDIDMMLALAYDASKILVYEAPNSLANFLDVLAHIANDDLASSVSCSWGIPENFAPLPLIIAENYVFAQMALQGQSFFDASGDNGAFDDGQTLSVDNPADEPYVTGVGGTTLATNGPGGTYASETVWNNNVLNGGGGGGGGISIYWAQPYYQFGLVSSASLGSKTMRNVPDVALDADPNTGYDIFVTDQADNPPLLKGWLTIGGTSAAAPLWAAFLATVNGVLAFRHQPPVGFVNPPLYTIARDSTRYANDFHDITVGDNGYYPAVPGYDAATGLGSFNGFNLYNDLLSNAPTPNAFWNPGFEYGFDSFPWVATPGVITDSVLEVPHSGQWYAWLCGYPLPHTDILEQQVGVGTHLSLTFYLHIDTMLQATTPVDTLKVEAIDTTTNNVYLLHTFSNLDANTGYTQETLTLPNILTNRLVIIRLVGTQNTFAPTSFVVDDFYMAP